MTGKKEQQIIYYDDECNLCHLSKEFYEIRDKEKNTLFFPVEQLRSEEMTGPLPDQFLDSPSVILFQNGKYYQKSEAILRSVRQLPRWKWLYGFIILPKWLRDLIYDLVAKYRYGIFGRRSRSGLEDKT
ncbi:MAG TPA: thiol-disulfide oxidoreductase [Saprospirales bacterium]|nr:thiol-disulfide oxidoreductase [Saprospirales bacterium]